MCRCRFIFMVWNWLPNMPFLLGYSSLVARRSRELLVSNVKFAWSWTKLTTCVREVLFKFIIVKFEFP